MEGGFKGENCACRVGRKGAVDALGGQSLYLLERKLIAILKGYLIETTFSGGVIIGLYFVKLGLQPWLHYECHAEEHSFELICTSSLPISSQERTPSLQTVYPLSLIRLCVKFHRVVSLLYSDQLHLPSTRPIHQPQSKKQHTYPSHHGKKEPACIIASPSQADSLCHDEDQAAQFRP